MGWEFWEFLLPRLDLSFRTGLQIHENWYFSLNSVKTGVSFCSSLQRIPIRIIHNSPSPYRQSWFDNPWIYLPRFTSVTLPIATQITIM